MTSNGFESGIATAGKRQIRSGSGTIAAKRIEQIGEWGEAHFREPATRNDIQSAEASLGHPLPDQLVTC